MSDMQNTKVNEISGQEDTEVKNVADISDSMVEDLLVIVLNMVRSKPGSKEVLASAISRSRSGERVSVDQVEAVFETPAEDVVEVMARQENILVLGQVDMETMFSTFPAGTPIHKEPDEHYKETLDWMKLEDLLENKGNFFVLREPVKFVTPTVAMMMIAGKSRSWVSPDERKINFGKSKTPILRNFVMTGVKARRA